MNDREMLEWAAKAAGVDCAVLAYDNDGSAGTWNPRTDSGDALELAAKLRISIDLSKDCVCAISPDQKHVALKRCIEEEITAATRLVILIVAAAIGKHTVGKS